MAVTLNSPINAIVVEVRIPIRVVMSIPPENVLVLSVGRQPYWPSDWIMLSR
jgi:hypothetical protein